MRADWRAWSVFVPLLIAIGAPSHAASAPKGTGEWSLSITKNVERSKRTYLLAYIPDQKIEKEITVTSECRKPFNTEATYGECSHSVVVQPGNKTFTLKTGEDVVMVDNPFGAPILGTVAYGCCGGPGTVVFYSDNGEKLGSLDGFSLDLKTNSANLFTRKLEMKNTAEGYMLVRKGKTDDLEALVFRDGHPMPDSLPLVIPIEGKKKCEYWHLDDFVHYGDAEYLTLKMKGSFCTEQVEEEQEFHCSRMKSVIVCSATKQKAPAEPAESSE